MPACVQGERQTDRQTDRQRDRETEGEREGERERTRECSGVLFYKGTNLIRPGPLPSWTHLTLIIFPKDPSPNTITMRVTSSTYEILEGHKHSVRNIIGGHNCGRLIDQNEKYRKFLKQFKGWRDHFVWGEVAAAVKFELYSEEGADDQLGKEAQKQTPWEKHSHGGTGRSFLVKQKWELRKRGTLGPGYEKPQRPGSGSQLSSSW